MRATTRMRWLAVVLAIGAVATVAVRPGSARAPMSWSEVEPKLRDSFAFSDEAQAQVVEIMVRWPAQIDSSWSREVFGREVSEQDLRELEQLAEPKNVMLRMLAEEYGRSLSAAIDLARTQADYRRAVRTLPDAPPGHDSAFYTATTACGGWVAALELTRSTHPELAQMRERIFALRRERDFELAHEIARRSSPQ